MRQSRINPLRHHHLVLLAAVLAIGACGGGPEATDESAADVAAETADVDDAAASDAGEAVDGDDDASEVAATVLPEWFPDDVYVPETYSVAGAIDAGDVQRLELAVAGGNVAELTGQARAGMLGQGWTEGASTGESTAYTKGQRSAMLTVDERDDGSTRIGYQFTTL